MKKVFFTCNRLGCGGAERVICTLCNELAKNGVLCSIVCLDILEGFYYTTNDGVDIIQLDKNISKRQSWISRKFCGLLNLYRLYRLLKTKRPDVVCSFYSKQNCYSILCTKLLHIPVICAERDHLFLTDGRVSHFLRLIFYKHADGFIHQTEWVKEYLEEKYKVTSDSLVLPNPLWINSFPDRKPIKGNLIAVGRLYEQKNYLGLIRAFLKAHSLVKSNITLSIYGEGPSRNEIEQLISDEEAQYIVMLKGRTDDVLTEYGKAEMFILFSHGEGYPNVLLEAMSCGVPCISSDCPIGGPAAMINNGVNGILVDSENEEELAQAIVNLHEDDDMQNKFSHKAIEIRKSNSLDVIFPLFYNYLQYIVAKRNSTK